MRAGKAGMAGGGVAAVLVGFLAGQLTGPGTASAVPVSGKLNYDCEAPIGSGSFLDTEMTQTISAAVPQVSKSDEPILSGHAYSVYTFPDNGGTIYGLLAQFAKPGDPQVSVGGSGHQGMSWAGPQNLSFRINPTLDTAAFRQDQTQPLDVQALSPLQMTAIGPVGTYTLNVGNVNLSLTPYDAGGNVDTYNGQPVALNCTLQSGQNTALATVVTN